MSELIERIAKAFKVSGMRDPDDRVWFAVKALEAIREPTAGMVIAGSSTEMGLSPEDVALGWQAMIDEALTDPAGGRYVHANHGAGR